MAELFANDTATTLAAAVDAATTSLSVVSASGFPAPAAGDRFRVRIDNEILTVTAVAGTTWTVARGAEGTTAAAHDVGAVVTHVVTAAALRALGNVTRGVYTTVVPPRPTDAVYVEWVGQADPVANALDGDTWTPTA